MKIKRVTYFALTAFVFAASCSKEAAEPGVYEWADGKIYFKTSLSDVASSRAQDMTLDKLESFQVTCFNTADRDKDEQGYLLPYFENATFVRKPNETYESSPSEEPREWPTNEGLLRFFAFSPSLSVMENGNSALEETDESGYFNLINSSTEEDSDVAVGYRLGTVRINPDISRQFDFITAEASGERWKDFGGGVNLAFSHQLCQVELNAWGAGENYEFDIAGVRIGNPVVEGTFIFADEADPDVACKWDVTDGGFKDKVEYLYSCAGTTASADTQGSGDIIYRINSRTHNTAESAASIMGHGGCAMVIPTKNDKWEGTDDPNIGVASYSTDKMYFSILMRVTDCKSGNVVYPYPGNKKGMKVISYVADRAGNIISRLYSGEREGTYFTDSELQLPYVAKDGEETMDFGWAAVPVDVDWSAGKRYVYTLNYSEGIGLHDPSDPEPGKLIVGQTPVEWSVSVGKWDYAEPNDDYTPDLDVP